MCSRRARDYMVAYKVFEKIDNKGDLQHDNDGCKDKSIKMNYHLIEKV
jgi:hypothetical protein